MKKLVTEMDTNCENDTCRRNKELKRKEEIKRSCEKYWEFMHSVCFHPENQIGNIIQCYICKDRKKCDRVFWERLLVYENSGLFPEEV